MLNKFQEEFSPYGKTTRDWLRAWSELHFNQYLVKFNDLASLLQFPPDRKLDVFKLHMPPQCCMAIGVIMFS